VSTGNTTENYDLRALFRSVGWRFWSKVDIREPHECWPWKGYRLPRGYGVFCANGKATTAHRFAYELQFGEAIPEGKFGCHSCDSPGCCNPAHVWPGTHAENMADAKAKGRMMGRKARQACGTRQGSAKLNDLQACGVVARWLQGVSINQVAREFGVNWTSVDRIIKGERWKHVFEIALWGESPARPGMATAAKQTAIPA
jgi:hypothetical protein